MCVLGVLSFFLPYMLFLMLVVSILFKLQLFDTLISYLDIKFQKIAQTPYLDYLRHVDYEKEMKEMLDHISTVLLTDISLNSQITYKTEEQKNSKK